MMKDFNQFFMETYEESRHCFDKMQKRMSKIPLARLKLPMKQNIKEED